MLIAFGSAEALFTAGIGAMKNALADPNTESRVKYGLGFLGRNQPKLRILGTLKLDQTTYLTRAGLTSFFKVRLLLANKGFDQTGELTV